MSFDPMTFNPLGNFNPDADVDEKVLELAKNLFNKLPFVPEGDLNRIYYHWSVAQMCDAFGDYNVMVLMDNDHEFTLDITNDLKDNAISTFNSTIYAAHTYCRNEGGVGICLAGMDKATPTDFGPDAITVAGLTYLCAAGGAVAKKYSIDVAGLSGAAPRGSYAGEFNLLTHAEAANLPGEPPQYAAYGPPPGTSERWDLASLTPLKNGAILDKEMATICGNALRELTHKYKLALL